MKIQDFQDNVTCGGFDNIFANIYKPQDIESQKSRYMSAVEKFTARIRIEMIYTFICSG